MVAALPVKKRKVIDQILRVIRQGKTFFLSGHEKPDGDTIGCELAFASLLRRLKKKVDIYNNHPVPRVLRFLPKAETIRTAKKIADKYDVALIFECSGPDRMGNIIDLKTQAKTVINIDHHIHHSHFGHINLIDSRASSNSEQLYHFFKRAKMPLTRDEAMCLYAGIVTDTGRFQQENTTPESHAVAMELLKTGIPVSDICRRIFNDSTPSALRLLARALTSLRLESNDRIAVLSLSQKDFSETGATAEDTEDIINYGLMLSPVSVVLFIRETESPGQIKVSLRGKGTINLVEIAVRFGGGGHKNAAGCTVTGTISSATETFLSQVVKALP